MLIGYLSHTQRQKVNCSSLSVQEEHNPLPAYTSKLSYIHLCQHTCSTHPGTCSLYWIPLILCHTVLPLWLSSHSYKVATAVPVPDISHCQTTTTFTLPAYQFHLTVTIMALNEHLLCHTESTTNYNIYPSPPSFELLDACVRTHTKQYRKHLLTYFTVNFNPPAWHTCRPERERRRERKRWERVKFWQNFHYEKSPNYVWDIKNKPVLLQNNYFNVMKWNMHHLSGQECFTELKLD